MPRDKYYAMRLPRKDIVGYIRKSGRVSLGKIIAEFTNCVPPEVAIRRFRIRRAQFADPRSLDVSATIEEQVSSGTWKVICNLLHQARYYGELRRVVVDGTVYYEATGKKRQHGAEKAATRKTPARRRHTA